MMKRTLFPLFCMMLLSFSALAQGNDHARQFWENLQKHCGKAYEGRLADGISHPDFDGHRLVMHVISCDENTIRVPFHVGEDRSRTWVLTYHDGVIKLKHDHRLEDGSEDEKTQYGGISPNGGFPHLQFFPADEETAALIPYAAANVWWITLTDEHYIYNLRRTGNDNRISVVFDFDKPVETPPAPWGWED